MTGNKANRSGGRLEAFVADVLDECGYRQLDPDKFDVMRHLEQPVWAPQYVTGTNIYHKRRRVDAVLYHPRKWPDGMVIQCKWQASSGSVEEKYPFEVMSIERDGIPAILVLDGGGYTSGAKAWLKAQAGPGRVLRYVVDQGGLQRLASRGIL